MAFFKKPKKTDSVRGQLGGLVRQIGVEVAGELKETGKEFLGQPLEPKKPTSGSERDWAQEWLKDHSLDKPDISAKTGQHSTLDLQEQFRKQEDQELKQVQARLNQMFRQPSSQSEYGQAKAKEQQEAQQSVYDRVWQERQKKPQKEQQLAAKQPGPALAATGRRRTRGDWQHGVKRKRQPTPQELNRPEFRGSQGQ